MKNFGA